MKFVRHVKKPGWGVGRVIKDDGENVLIYFDDESRKTASETFFEALNPGGYLCLGHSESMSRISSLFEVRKFPEAIVYRKSLEAK